MTSDSGPSQISVVLDTTATEAVTREWSMKIYQYECSSPDLAPSGCLQYFTAASGQFQSFNYKTDVRESPPGPSHLANLNYAVCFRIENGFCGIKYGQVTSDTFSFTISGDSRSVHLNCLNRVCSSRDTVEWQLPRSYIDFQSYLCLSQKKYCNLVSDFNTSESFQTVYMN